MPCSRALLNILREAGTEVKFAEWCDTNRSHKPIDLALVAPAEDRVEDELVKVAAAAGVPAQALHEKIALRKAWALARQAMNKPCDQDDVDEESKGLLHSTEVGLRSSCLRRHSFVLSSERLLKENLQKRLHAMLTSD